mgnify:CR=1 FL=1
MAASMAEPLFFANVVCTLLLAGLIWFVQVVHYPLFGHVGVAESARYAEAHQRRTTWVVAPLMIGELLTAAALPFWGPVELSSAACGMGLLLVVVIWWSTFRIQVPLHERLLAGYTAAVGERLVRTNWLRTWAWSLLAAVVTAMAISLV